MDHVHRVSMEGGCAQQWLRQGLGGLNQRSMSRLLHSPTSPAHEEAMVTMMTPAVGNPLCGRDWQCVLRRVVALPIWLLRVCLVHGMGRSEQTTASTVACGLAVHSAVCGAPSLSEVDRPRKVSV